MKNKRLIVLNFKRYSESTGDAALKLAKICDVVAKENNINTIVALQYMNIYRISYEIDIPVFAQGIENIMFGSNTGHILPESIKSAGASGCFLNHSKNRLRFTDIDAAIQKLKEMNMTSIVCPNNIAKTKAAAALSPDYGVVEPPELIGSGISGSKAQSEVITGSVDDVREINPDVKVLCEAGISSVDYLKSALDLGAEGVLLASGIVCAKAQPEAITESVDDVKKINPGEKIEIEEKPEVTGPIGEKARKIFLGTKKCWETLGMKKDLPGRYIIRVAPLKEKALYGLTINIYWDSKNNPKNAICTVVLISTEIAKSIIHNTNKKFAEYVLLHEMNHAASAMITNARSAKDMFAEMTIDYLTMLELSCINNEELEFINELVIFMHTIITCSENNDEVALKGVFNYCFNKRVRNSVNARKNLAKSLGVMVEVINKLEKADHFKDMKKCAREVFKDFDKTFEKYTLKSKPG